MKKVTLFIFILWAAIGMSVAAIYIPVSSDPAEAQKPIFERQNVLDADSADPLNNILQSRLTNETGNNVDLSLQILSPLVSLIQVQLDSLTGEAPYVALIQVNLEPPVVTPINTGTVVPTDTPRTEPTPTVVEPPKEEVKTNTTNTTDTNTTYKNVTETFNETDNTNETDPGTNKTDDGNETDPGTGNKYLVENFDMSSDEFTADVTNHNDNVEGDGYYEISTSAASNHLDVLQSGTFSYQLGTFTINDVLIFIPTDSTEYYLHVYTNYPEDDNRVSKASRLFIYTE